MSKEIYMDGFLTIGQAAADLGYGPEPTEKDKATVRTLLKHFSVEVKVEAIDQFPGKRTTFNEVQVRRVAEFKL
jgi:hypothetical protein